MVSQIQLGNFYNSGGKTLLAGISGSGLDTQGLIKGLTDAKAIPATKLQDQITTDNDQLTALTTMKNMLSDLKDLADGLRNAPGNTLLGGTNIFDSRTTQISSNSGISGGNYVTATIAAGTPVGSYVISDITQVATAKSQATGNFVLNGIDDVVVNATQSAGFFGAGTITIHNPVSLAPQNISLATNDTLRTVAQKFNAVSDVTGISANIVQVSSGNYKLIFTATATGVASDFDLDNSSVPGSVTDTGGTVLGGITFSDDQLAYDASFKLNNVAITRSSNNIDDLVTGITFNLLQDTVSAPLTKITVKVTPDGQAIQDGVSSFINAYNNFRLFVSSQTQLQGDGTPDPKAVLFSNTTMHTIFDQLSAQASSIVSGIANGQPSSLAEIGITFINFAGSADYPATKNILSLDSAKLQSALSTNFTGVKNVFGYNLVSSSTNLQIYKSSNLQKINNFTLDVDQVGGIYTAHYLDANNVTQNVTLTGTTLTGGAGVTLTGPAGSVLDGLQLIYSGSTSATGITVSTSQGIGDQLFNSLNSVLQSKTGIVALNQKSLTDRNTQLNVEIDRINAQVDLYRQQLLERYSALEAALTRFNSILNQLTANQDAANKN